jgi:hypothetical protein
MDVAVVAIARHGGWSRRAISERISDSLAGLAARISTELLRGSASMEVETGIRLACGRAGSGLTTPPRWQATFHQAIDQGHHIGGHGMAQRDDFHIGGVGDIGAGDDARDALQIVGVVGDDQRVVAGLTLMVLLGLISGRSTGTRLLAFS